MLKKTQKKLNLVLLSGGMDSACLLAWLRYLKKDCEELKAVFIDYGQRNAEKEYAAAAKICCVNVVPCLYIKADNLFAFATSAILNNTAVDEHSVKADELPNRNATLISIAAANVAPNERAVIYVGAHKTSAPYADATPKFYRLMNKLIRYSTNNRISVKAPFIHLSKLELARLGRKAGMTRLEFDSTVSCYEGNECGVCPACIQRAKVMKEIFR